MSRHLTLVQLAAVCRMEPPPHLTACAAYLEHVRTCRRGCCAGPGPFAECPTGAELRAPAEAEWEALPAGHRSDGWVAKP